MDKHAILIIGGTTEGLQAVEVCEEAGKPFVYSTKGKSQDVRLHHGTLLQGGLTEAEMVDLCRQRGVELIVDAAHPFAVNVHKTVGAVARTVGLQSIRFERRFPPIPREAHRVTSWAEAVDLLERLSPRRLLALTGVSSIAKLDGYWQHHETYVRVMPIEETELLVSHSSFPKDHIIYYDRESDDRELMSQLQPDLLLIKESGDSSGFEAKVRAALDLSISVIIIARPPLGYTPSAVVRGQVGLRRSIEHLLPEFFPQKIGFTTGTTATAATKAALLALLNEEVYTSVEVTLPSGEEIQFPIRETILREDGAEAIAVKCSGDDPDVTDGAEIHAEVTLAREKSGVHFLKGEGVGTVTLPGIGLPIGEPAINRVPRQMMTDTVSQLVDTQQMGVEIRISVPQGRALAEKTFNPRLGIVDGISILGTSGVVKPYSNEAFVESIRRELEVSRAVDGFHLVLNSGGRSERFLKDRFSSLSPNAFVQYGNFIGESLGIAHELHFPRISLGIMLGKAVKLAAGELDTHSKKVLMDKEFVRSIAETTGATDVQVAAIEQISMAREIWEILPDYSSAFYQEILKRCLATCSPLVPASSLEILLMDDHGTFVELRPDKSL